MHHQSYKCWDDVWDVLRNAVSTGFCYFGNGGVMSVDKLIVASPNDEYTIQISRGWKTVYRGSINGGATFIGNSGFNYDALGLGSQQTAAWYNFGHDIMLVEGKRMWLSQEVSSRSQSITYKLRDIIPKGVYIHGTTFVLSANDQYELMVTLVLII